MTALLQLDDLIFKWPKSEKPLLEVNAFNIEPGERIFLHGPSGCGKSTLLNIVGGVLSPNSGTIRFLGDNLTQKKASALDRIRGDRMGFIFQTFNLLPYLTATENVILPCQFSAIKTKKVLSQASSLKEEAHRLLSSLQLAPEEHEGKAVTQLSIGQQQRVATARAMMGSPELIIADEPTSALDADTRNIFLDLLFAESSRLGSSILFVSHDFELGKKFDRCISLTDLNDPHPSDAEKGGH